jgi:L-ascorbate metabolism protein UlaG (beta-lactamase superfamily)
MEIHLLRHATLLVTIAGRRLLVDPMLANPGTAPPVANSPNQRPNPLVPLPLPARDAAAGIDAVLVTHTHRDHWDDAAVAVLAKTLPIFCQVEDEAKIRGAGFSDVRPVRESAPWDDVTLHRTGGRHGTGEVGRRLAPVSGFVLRAPGEPVLYIAGDTIWCPEVDAALREYAPAVAVVNAGAAQFLEGGPITMTADDVAAAAQAAPAAKIVAVHMESINHCVMRRPDLAAALRQAGLASRVAIPADGERMAV